MPCSRRSRPGTRGTLRWGLHQLVEAELLYQQGLPPQATYRFKHAHIQEAAYPSPCYRACGSNTITALPRYRRPRFPDLCETQPELLGPSSSLYGRPTCLARPSPYWQQARPAGSVAKFDFWGQNPKIGYQKFNDLQTAKLSKKHFATEPAALQRSDPCVTHVCPGALRGRGQIQATPPSVFEHIHQRHYGMKLMAYTLINLRGFCGV